MRKPPFTVQQQPSVVNHYINILTSARKGEMHCLVEKRGKKHYKTQFFKTI